MNIKNCKPAFTQSLLSIEPLADTWQYFEDLYNSSNPAEAINFANRGKFNSDIYNFNPVFTPFEDFEARISRFELSGRHYKIDVDKFIMLDPNAVIDDDEFVRLILVHILHTPDDKSKPKFLIFNTSSESKPYIKGKKYKFRVPVPYPHLDDVRSYKYQAVHAFFVNFFHNREILPNGSVSYSENIFSFSSSDSLNIYQPSPSDLQKILPPAF